MHPQWPSQETTNTMYAPAVLWLARFSTRASTGELNVTLRTEILPAIEAHPDIHEAFAGYRAGEGDWQYIVGACEAGEAPGEALCETQRSLAERSPVELSPIEVSAQPILLTLEFPAEAQPHILRVFDGEVREGLLESYLEAARQGTIADSERGRGPLALILASSDPSRFTTISLWPDWDHIEAATGGNVLRPLASKRHEGLLGGEASHYELVAEPKLLEHVGATAQR